MIENTNQMAMLGPLASQISGRPDLTWSQQRIWDHLRLFRLSSATGPSNRIFPSSVLSSEYHVEKTKAAWKQQDAPFHTFPYLSLLFIYFYSLATSCNIWCHMIFDFPRILGQVWHLPGLDLRKRQCQCRQCRVGACALQETRTATQLVDTWHHLALPDLAELHWLVVWNMFLKTIDWE